MQQQFDDEAALAGSQPIADYGLIGDMRGAALVGKTGAMDWLCLARFDAVPVFAGLLDASQGGACTVNLSEPLTSTSRRYLPGTNILETTLRSASGTLVITDFMAVGIVEEPGDARPDSVAPGRVVRMIRCASGTVCIIVRVEPSFDWARRTASPVLEGRRACYPGESLYLAASHELVAEAGAVQARATLQPDETLTVVLSHVGLDVTAVGEAAAELRETADYWTRWNAYSSYRGPHADHVGRSALCLKLLTYAPTGAVIAAPTMGLPEAVGGVRNWDYRFVWTRDASFSVSAFLNLGYRHEAAEFLRFLHDACAEEEVVKVMYGVDGPVPAEEKLHHLAGWRGSVPILVGNEASGQKQHEIYGELLAALNLYVSAHGTDGLCQSLKNGLLRFVQRLAVAAIETWKSPDQGIWELRGEPRHLLHTKAMCWVALDRALKLAPLLGMNIPDTWVSKRDAIRQECLDRGWNAEINAFTMEFGGRDLDMSTLRLSLMGLLDASEPRMTATLKATNAELGDGDLYRRYRFDDGLPGLEGAFAACSFWVVGFHTLRGELEPARDLLDRLLQRSNDLGLFAEEFALSTGEQIGNFPQGFTHMAVIHEAVRLHQAETAQRAGEPSC